MGRVPHQLFSRGNTPRRQNRLLDGFADRLAVVVFVNDRFTHHQYLPRLNLIEIVKDILCSLPFGKGSQVLLRASVHDRNMVIDEIG